MRRIPDAELVELYGMTKLSPGATFMRHGLDADGLARLDVRWPYCDTPGPRVDASCRGTLER